MNFELILDKHLIFITSPCEDDDDLSLGLSPSEVGDDLGKGSPDTLFVHLRDLTADADLTIGTIDLGKLLERLH